MRNRARQAALRILMLLEEFSPEELAEAIALLGEGEERDLPTFLARLASSAPRRSSARDDEGKSGTPGETKALQALKATDPEKYRLLREFETRVREGAVLRTLPDLRAFGESLTKRFGPVKSRKEALERLMAELSSLDVNAARAAINRASPLPCDPENGLRRFANHLLSTVNQPPSEGSSQTE